MNQSHYETLGLTKEASQSEIKKAYRKLVMKYHPDTNSSPGIEVKFKEITKAYEALTQDGEKNIMVK